MSKRCLIGAFNASTWAVSEGAYEAADYDADGNEQPDDLRPEFWSPKVDVFVPGRESRDDAEVADTNNVVDLPTIRAESFRSD